MFSVFFGNYLLNRGIISAQQLEEVLVKQKETRLKLGTLAINENLMTVNQVKRIHLLQMKKDKYFGELSVEEGYISESDLARLLKKQKSEHLILAQTLIDEGYITLEEYEHELDRYKEMHSLSDNSFDALLEGNVSVVINELLNIEFKDHDKLYKEYIELFFKNAIRFIDTNIRFEEIDQMNERQYEVLASQIIKDTDPYYTAIAGKKEHILKVASIFAEEEFIELTDYPKDAFGEFLNLHNGIFLVNMSNNNHPMDISVQEVAVNKKIVSEREMYRIPCQFPFGTLDLIIGKK